MKRTSSGAPQVPFRHRMVAASTGALLTSLITNPLDVVKTRLQVGARTWCSVVLSAPPRTTPWRATIFSSHTAITHQSILLGNHPGTSGSTGQQRIGGGGTSSGEWVRGVVRGDSAWSTRVRTRHTSTTHQRHTSTTTEGQRGLPWHA